MVKLSDVREGSIVMVRGRTHGPAAGRTGPRPEGSSARQHHATSRCMSAPDPSPIIVTLDTTDIDRARAKMIELVNRL